MFDVQGKEEEVLICLQQEDRRIWRKNGTGENLPIGFEVLRVSEPRNQIRPRDFPSKVAPFLTSLSAGGGEPLQPGAVCGGAGGQLRLHGLPQRDVEGGAGSGPLRCAAHHLSARGHRTLPAAPLLPFSYQTMVCERKKKGSHSSIE